MLKKLLKYEYMATSRVFLPLFGLVLALSVANALMSTAFAKESILDGLVMAAFVISLIAVYIINIAIIVARFNTNLLGKEGYLSFTLPVSAGQHIGAKLIVAFTWNVLTVVVTVLAMFIVTKFEGFHEFFRGLGEFIANEGLGFTLMVLASAIMSALNFILLIYTSLSISSSLKIFKNRVLGGALVYFIISLVVSLVSNLLMQIWFNSVVSGSSPTGFGVISPFISGVAGSSFFTSVFYEYMMDVMTFNLIIGTICIILYFFITRYYLSKRLNLTD